MFRYLPFAFLLSLLTIPSAFAKAPSTSTKTDTSRTDSTTLSTTQTDTGGNAAYGSIETRPSLDTVNNRVYFQNYVDFGYKFSSVFSLGYSQQFDQEIYKDSGSPSGMALNDGYLKAVFKNLGIDNRLGVTFTMESRLYAPTDPMKRNNGFITAWRNYFKFEKKVTEGWSMMLWEVPIVHVYNQAGATTATGDVANPIFENRVYFGPNFSFFSKKLVISVPIILSHTRYQDWADNAPYNGAWNPVLWMYPEITYKLSPAVNIGVAYESGNFLNDPAATTPGGFNGGTTQLILGVSF